MTQNGPVATRLNAVLGTTGLAVFISFLVSVIISATAPTDSGQQGFGRGAVSVTVWLVLSWTVAAILFATFRWKMTTTRFRVTLVLNGIMAMLISAGFYLWR